MRKMSGDDQLRALIESARQAMKVVRNKSELLDIVQTFADYKGKLRIENKALKYTSLLGIGLAAVALIDNYLLGPSLLLVSTAQDWGVPTSFVAWIFAGPILVPTIFNIAMVIGDSKEIPELSKELARRSSWFTNGLVETDTPLEPLLEQLQRSFNDYSRGNYSRKIQRALKGRHAGTRQTLEYLFIDLEYVEKRQETYTTTDSKGSTTIRTRTVFDHHQRYSLVVGFPWMRGIAVRGDLQDGIDYPNKYQTSSTAFNEVFTLSGTTAMDCARFAKPVTVLHLLSIKTGLHSLNLEFAADGAGLCISFDNDITDFDMPCDLSTPGAFFQHLDSGIALPTLTRLLEAIHVLVEQHDDNFELSNQPNMQMEQ